jgi:group 4 capsule polysaccharide lipoprotein GfcB/YjbF
MAAPFPLMRKTRSAFLAAALMLALAGCSDIGSATSQTDIGKVGLILYRLIGGIGSSASVPRERAAAIPYATLGVRLGGSDEAMFVLANKSGDDLLWLGGASVGVTTRQGRVVHTVGFEHNISGVHAAEGVKQDLSQPSVDYLYDFAEQSRYGVPVKCTRQNLGAERITIIGVPRDTIHVAEDCSASGMDWSFRNEYWADSTGFVWKSRQFTEPRLDPLTLEVLRPASG